MRVPTYRQLSGNNGKSDNKDARNDASGNNSGLKPNVKGNNDKDGKSSKYLKYDFGIVHLEPSVPIPLSINPMKTFLSIRPCHEQGEREGSIPRSHSHSHSKPTTSQSNNNVKESFYLLTRYYKELTNFDKKQILTTWKLIWSAKTKFYKNFEKSFLADEEIMKDEFTKKMLER